MLLGNPLVLDCIGHLKLDAPDDERDVHGEGVEFFKSAVDELIKEGWVKMDGDMVKLDMVVRVSRRFLAKAAKRASKAQ